MTKEYCIIDSEKIKSRTDDSMIDLVLQTLDMGKQVLVFNNSKRSSQTTAQKVADSIKDNEIENPNDLDKLSEKILKSIPYPTRQCKALARYIKKGIAFHHSGLVAKQRFLVEKYFKKGLIKVISSTPTLAAGLNLPAYKVIIKDYKRYSQRGIADIPILEFHQMAGRAGRPGSENIGRSVICVNSQDELEKVVPKYIFGEPEEIISKLAVEPTLKMYILSLIAMDVINTKEEIKNFFANTLYAYQYKDTDALNFNIFRIIEILKDYKFITYDDDYYIATQLGKKISELYINPDTAYYFLENIDKFVKIFEGENISKYDIYSLVNFVVNTIEMRPLFRVSKPQEEIYAKKVQEIGDDLIVKFDPFDMDYNIFVNSLKTTDILIDWISEAPEDYISEKYNVTPGELNYKVEVVDWLLYCLEELAYLRKEVYFKNYLGKLRLRFKFGIKADLISLISIKGIGRIRARKLFDNGFKKILDLRKAETQSIARVVGEKLALNIKDMFKDDDKNQSILSQAEILGKPKMPFIGKPKEIEMRDVSDVEVDILITNYKQFEKEKKERQMDLTDYF